MHLVHTSLGRWAARRRQIGRYCWEPFASGVLALCRVDPRACLLDAPQSEDKDRDDRVLHPGIQEILDFGDLQAAGCLSLQLGSSDARVQFSLRPHGASS